MQKWRFFSRKIWKVEIILQDTFSNAMRSSTNEIDQYISGFPKEVQIILEQIRAAIRQEAPEAEETIKYAIPTYVLHGNLVHFAGYKNHIGFYPAPSGIEEFKAELSVYKGAKGSIQFPLNKPMPLDLITRIVKFRVKENLDRSLRKNA